MVVITYKPVWIRKVWSHNLRLEYILAEIPGYILGFRIPRTGFQSLSVELGIRISIVSGIPYSKTQDSGFLTPFPYMG